MTSRRPYRPQRVDDLRERITLQRIEWVDDGFSTVERPVDVATVFARIEPVKSQDEFIAGGIRATEAVNAHIRHRDDLTTAWRFRWQGRTYLIDGIRNLDERRQYLTLTANWRP